MPENLFQLGDTLGAVQGWFLLMGAILYWIKGQNDRKKKNSECLEISDILCFDCESEHISDPENKKTSVRVGDFLERYALHGKMNCHACFMKRIGSYGTFEKCMRATGAELVDDPSVFVDRLTLMKSKCNLGHDYKSQYNNHKKPCPECKKESVKPPPAKQKCGGFEDLVVLFSSHGAKVISVLKTPRRANNVVRTEDEWGQTGATTKDKVRWSCAWDESHVEEQAFHWIIKQNGGLEGDDPWLCKGCRKHGNTDDYANFRKAVESEGYVFLTEAKDYRGSMSPVWVRCPAGDEFETTKNRWTSAMKHRCGKCHHRSRAKGLEECAAEAKTKGLRLIEGQTYVDNKTGLDYECERCGSLNQGLLPSNVARKPGDGCDVCKRKLLYSDAEEFCNDSGCMLLGIKYEEDSDYSRTLFVRNSSWILFICSCAEKGEKMWKTFKNAPRCFSCVHQLIGETLCELYKDPEMRDKVKVEKQKRAMKKIGATHHMKLKEYTDKAKETNVKNHDGVHNLATPEIRKKCSDAFESKYGGKLGTIQSIRDKTVATNQKKYGTDFPINSRHVKDMMLAFCGAEFHGGTDRFKEKMMALYGSECYVTSNKSKKEMMELYGTEFFMQSKGFKEVMMRLYGVEHAMHSEKLFAKAMKNAFRRKSVIMPSGKIRLVQGYEPFAIEELLQSGFHEDDIVTGKGVPVCWYKFKGKDHKYFPDIYIKSLDLIVEIKSMWTMAMQYDQNIAKFQEACKYHKFQVWIYDDKKKKIDVREFRRSVLVF